MVAPLVAFRLPFLRPISGLMALHQALYIDLLANAGDHCIGSRHSTVQWPVASHVSLRWLMAIRAT